MCQLVAFNSLLTRNKTGHIPDVTSRRMLLKNKAGTEDANDDDGDDYDDVQLKLPFIVVNTSKDTVVDCWLSTDRFTLSLSVCLSVCLVCNIKFIKYRENKLIVTKFVQNVRHWHEHKHASTFAIGQLSHQSATAPSRATHAVDAVAAHRCHELWSHTHVTE